MRPNHQLLTLTFAHAHAQFISPFPSTTSYVTWATMKFGISQVVICLMATAAPAVQAVECTKGLKYCGWNLRDLGKCSPALAYHCPCPPFRVPLLLFGTFNFYIRISWKQEETNQLMNPTIGWDQGELFSAVQSAGQTPTNGAVRYSLYECVSRRKIKWSRRCGDFNCANGGGGKSDFCT